MADDVAITAGAGTNIATDDIGGRHFQRVKVNFGADGAASDVSSSNPLPVSASDPSTGTAFGPIAAANTELFTAVDTAGKHSIQLQITGRFGRGGVQFQSSMDGTTYQTTDTPLYDQSVLGNVLYSPDLVTVAFQGRFFRAVTTPDFVGSISGTYALRSTDGATHLVNTKLVDLETGLLFPVAGTTNAGHIKRIAVADNGGVQPAETMFTGTRLGASVGPIVQVDTTGYNSVAMQLTGTFTGTVTFQASNDGSAWSSVTAWPTAGGTAPVTTATAVGHWLIPAAARYIRAAITTAGSGQPLAIAVLKNASAFYPAATPSVTIAANSSINMAQVGGNAVVTAGVNGVQAIGGNIAVGAAPTANPVPVGGWDGTNTRRILTDAVSGGVALGAAGVSNGASVSTLVSAATNNLTQLKSGIGRLLLIDIQNTVASIRYLKLFNVPSASVTMGSTSATMNFSIPASGKLTIVTALGINLGGTGISFALTTGSGLTDNTAGGAGDLICNFMWV